MFFHTWEKSFVKLDNFLEFEKIFVLRHKLRNLFCFLIFWKTKEKEKRKKRGRDCHTYTHTHTRINLMSSGNKQVCKNYLCGLCPKSLFKNTKFKHMLSKSLRCNKIHSQRLKKESKKFVKRTQVHLFNKNPTYFHILERDLKKCIDFSQKLFNDVNGIVLVN